MLFFFLLLLEADTAHGDVRASNCSTVEEQQSSLVDLYSAWGGPSWRNNKGWLNTSMACEDSGVQLPAHCCWFGILCCLSRTCSRSQRADIDRCDCSEPGLVWAIELDSNNLEGNFSSLDHSAFACELYGLRVANNKLSGPIGQDFTLYEKIGYAELQENNLQGTLPVGLGKLFTLWSFFLGRNMLEGPLPSDICGENTRMFILSVENNRFSGQLDLARCTSLGFFFAEGNNFSTVFTSATPMLPSLRAVYLGQNNLVGRVPKDDLITRLPNLEEFGLFQNQLSGPLPEMAMFSLQHISLGDNRFTGPIPLSWSRVARPGFRVYLQTNYLSCCGTNPLPAEELTMAKDIQRIDQVYQGVDYGAPLLPPFLELTDILVPVRVFPRQSFKATGLRCPELKVSGDMDFEPTPGQPTDVLQWTLDPSYYMFEKCECEKGLQLVNLTKPGRLPYFECQAPLDATAENKSWEEAHPWAIVIIVVVGCALLITLLLGLYLYKGTEVVQRLNNLKKRMHGLPTSGPFTAVVTDIQGWTDLCSQHPELSWKVLSIHNSILRRARWNNFGSTHETEGDSFTMVFYDAKDAVAFCLQAQQMLSMQQWPSHEDANNEEQSAPLMPSYANPVSHQLLKKSRSTNSISVVNPLSSSKLHHNSDQEGTASMDIRVRMGLASGFLSSGESLHAHPTIAFAKEVSDAAVGGQILMESSTFYAVKDSLGELGTVDAQGMHLDRLRMRRVFNWSACFLFRSVAPSAAANDDAVVLDMGTYTKQPTQSHPHKARLDEEHKQAQAIPRNSTAGRTPKSLLFNRMSSLTGSARTASSPGDLHLYQVLPADGAERAKLWGSILRLKVPVKDSLSKGYFDAPGTLDAPLGNSKGSAKASLPLVTTVFASVEPARFLSSKETRQVERGLLACARNCLDLEQVCD
ncbi:hypothetical protein DUNSADRAFT_17322 [Dunaliella salina]|uniref:Guanylate cyclase domain-containing protein n=1 Tax=Dunaliella salina TaxID=3046 RepID=A0ABQ7G1Y0_DUNSA|nr:hypothetical protein DUNSADRAFT_17322 [Dunaliella salina]|eukprot:KAF5828609.1 hypothetical protein DUNSADRAFT_17322 [Dunaliella salina]